LIPERRSDNYKMWFTSKDQTDVVV